VAQATANAASNPSRKAEGNARDHLDTRSGCSLLIGETALDGFEPLVDRLALVAFDAELRRLPRPLVEAIWAGVDALRPKRQAP
jgi:hypothetical protein